MNMTIIPDGRAHSDSLLRTRSVEDELGMDQMTIRQLSHPERLEDRAKKAGK